MALIHGVEAIFMTPEQHAEATRDSGHPCPECETPDSLTRFPWSPHNASPGVMCSACGYYGYGNRGEHRPRAHEIKMTRIAERIEAAATRIEIALKENE